MNTQQAVKVLLIDDANNVTALADRYLQKQMTIDWMGCTVDATAAATFTAGVQPDVILLGLRSSTRADLVCLQRDFPEASVILMGFLDRDSARSITSNISVGSYIDKMELISELIPEIMRVAGQEKTIQPTEQMRHRLFGSHRDETTISSHPNGKG